MQIDYLRKEIVRSGTLRHGEGMTNEEVTLIVAFIAAGASTISLLMNLSAQKSAELRVSYRNSFEPYLATLERPCTR